MKFHPTLHTLGLPLLALFAAAPSACSARAPSNGESATHDALGESAPPLGTAGSFTVLAGTTVTNIGATTIAGDLGVSPGLAVTGFPPGIVSGGAIHAGDAVALQAQTDVTLAYDALAGEPCGVDLTGTDLGGLTLAPGVYCFSSSAQLTGTLTLDAQGRADAIFVFKIVSTLTTASDASVRVIGGGSECGVFWKIGSSAVLGTGTVFSGSLLALTSISLATGAKVSGRALARNGAVTMDDDSVSVGSCAAAPTNDAGVDGGDSRDATAPDASPIPIDSGSDLDASAPTPDAGSVPGDASALLDGGAGDACCDQTTCGGACVDLARDLQNCGACGHACATTETCSSGSCVACSASDQ